MILFLIFWDIRLYYVQDKYIKKIKWVTLEIRIPKENLKTPKSMEQIFSAIHATYSAGIKGYDKWIKGKVEAWMSFEIVGHNGGVYFFVRLPADYKNLVESAFFSQYPGAELNDVEDYTTAYPMILPNQVYELWGTDLLLGKEDPYPLKTYPSFEEKEEERRVDPMSIITEVMSKLKADETIWLQFLISPIGVATSDFKKEGQAIIDKMMGRDKKAQKGGLGSELYSFANKFIMAPAEHPVWGADKKEEAKREPQLSSGEKDIIKAIENKISKLAYNTIIRFVYIDKKDAFTMANVSAVMGAFKQFSTENLNYIKPNSDVTTSRNTWLANLSKSYKTKFVYDRKRKIIDRYRLKIMLPKSSVLCVEELATMYHVPTTIVEAPRLRRLEAKKGEPPAELPIG